MKPLSILLLAIILSGCAALKGLDCNDPKNHFDCQQARDALYNNHSSSPQPEMLYMDGRCYTQAVRGNHFWRNRFTETYCPPYR